LIKIRKFYLAEQNVVCCPKDEEGLGIHDLEVKKRALLSKWLFKLLIKMGFLANHLKRNYVNYEALSYVYRKAGESQF
jgi:hypothetical protein